ncbi:MAG: hypothetical protein LBH98_02215 [Chitinispirillales bacterium]|jgi:hypothetical protein|nr:hypothetical protein [Chitinispirillales bacterium]
MASSNLSPIEKILLRRKNEKVLAKEIYEKVFDVGIEKTAEKLSLTYENAVKLIIPIVRKNRDFDKFFALVEKQKLYSIYEKMKDLQTVSVKILQREYGNFAKEWEILIAKEFSKKKLKQEIFD